MWDEVRKLFPVNEHCTYLNNAGVSPPSTRVLEALEAYHRDHALYGVHKLLPRFVETGTRIKEILGEFLQCSPSCIALTHNTSEGMSIVAQGFQWKEGDCVLGLDQEYPSNVYPWWNLEKKGVRHLRLKPAHSEETLAVLKDGIDDNVRMVAVSAVDWCSGLRPRPFRSGRVLPAPGRHSCGGRGAGLGRHPSEPRGQRCRCHGGLGLEMVDGPHRDRGLLL